jgi:uncharacterized membrane protein YfcA
MYGAGLLSAFLGIGGGVLKIPAMDTAMRLPIKVSPSGTDRAARRGSCPRSGD